MFSPHPKPVKKKRTSRVAAWNYIRTKVVKPKFKKLNINYCEVAKYLYSKGVISEQQAYDRNFNLSFHHRHKRDWYKCSDRNKEEQMLGDYNQIIMVGDYYHDKLESSKELTERWFLALRGEEVL